jgi:hypothetical protein
MDEWLLGSESFSLFGQQLGAQKPRERERASEPTCLTSSRNKPTTQKRIQNRQARKTRAGDFGVLEDLRKSASSLSECVFGKTPKFFPFFFLTRSRLQLGSTSDFLKKIWRNLAKFRPTYTHVFSFHGKKMAQIRQISKGKFRHILNYFSVLSNFWKIIHYMSQNFNKILKKSSSLDKLDCSITMTSFYLLFFIIINCQKFHNWKTKSQS